MRRLLQSLSLQRLAVRGSLGFGTQLGRPNASEVLGAYRFLQPEPEIKIASCDEGADT